MPRMGYGVAYLRLCDLCGGLFPGQGSQYVGMGAELAQSSRAARAVFAAADDLLHQPLSRLCWEGPEAALNATHNTQPALYVCSLAALAALQEQAGSWQPAFAAGHSLGEITALTAAGALRFEDGLQLVRERGRLMQLAGERQPGGMAAVVGAAAAVVHAICAQATAESGQPVALANDNCPGQVVMSGHVAALQRAQLVLVPRKGADKADLADLRLDLCRELLPPGGAVVAPFDMPVREGMQIEAGHVLVRIDDRISKLRADGLRAQIEGVRVERARLRAERRLDKNQADAQMRTRTSSVSMICCLRSVGTGITKPSIYMRPLLIVRGWVAGLIGSAGRFRLRLRSGRGVGIHPERAEAVAVGILDPA